MASDPTNPDRFGTHRIPYPKTFKINHCDSIRSKVCTELKIVYGSHLDTSTDESHLGLQSKMDTFPHHGILAPTKSGGPLEEVIFNGESGRPRVRTHHNAHKLLLQPVTRAFHNVGK